MPSATDIRLRSAPKIAIIGAGLSGLAGAHALGRLGLSAEVFELGSQVGGLWRINNDNGRKGAYDSLVMNSSCKASQFSDLSFPEEAGHYATHAQVADYLSRYASQFRLAELVRFRTEVVSVAPEAPEVPESRLRVRTRDRETENISEGVYDAVIVASGHHFEPSLPLGHPLPDFSGPVLHSHDYRNPTSPIDLRGKRVCVVGLGNSAVDIATELSSSASQVFLSTRRGAWVLPKYLFGKPIDQGTLVPRWLPGHLRRRILTWSARFCFGNMEDFGLPKPDHRLGEAHPTLSDRLLPQLKAKKIAVRGPILRARGQNVEFAGLPHPTGSEATGPEHEDQVDVILYCTGYRVSFPFFDESFVTVVNNSLPLFGRVFHARERRLFFIGLVQTIGAIAPTAERQARWIAEHIGGRYSLPPPSELNLLLQQDQNARAARFVASPRHSLQVEPHEYAEFLKAELGRGRRRAARGEGQAFP